MARLIPPSSTSCTDSVGGRPSAGRAGTQPVAASCSSIILVTWAVSSGVRKFSIVCTARVSDVLITTRLLSRCLRPTHCRPTAQHQQERAPAGRRDPRRMRRQDRRMSGPCEREPAPRAPVRPVDVLSRDEAEQFAHVVRIARGVLRKFAGWKGVTRRNARSLLSVKTGRDRASNWGPE